MKSSAIQIVLLGGGYTSVWAYRSLVKNLRRELEVGSVAITVICPEKHHFFHGWTAESLTCIVQDKNRMSPLAKIFARATLMKAKAEEINSEANTVTIKLNNGSIQTLHYDHLLLGIGSFDSDKVEGIKEFGYQVKSDDAFHQAKNKLQSLVRRAAESDIVTAQKLLNITVAGGGFTGVELIANIAEFINLLIKQYPSLKNVRPTFRLINSTGGVLNILQPHFNRIIHYTEKVLKQYNIEVVNNCRITKVTAQGCRLSNGSFLSASMVISTIGQSRMILKGTENMLRDKLDRVYTNCFLQIRNHNNIWGGGDACNVRNITTKKACTANALWAMKHGEYAGRNIAGTVKGKSLKSFTYKALGQTASLGIGKGIGELYGLQFTGWIAWIMRFFVFNWFMPSKKVMIREVADWMFLLFTGKRKGLSLQQQSEETKKEFAIHKKIVVN